MECPRTKFQPYSRTPYLKVIKLSNKNSNTSRKQLPSLPPEEWLTILYDYTTTVEHKIVPTGDFKFSAVVI
jgi:hypothetical protein